ncbi:hypothetical protein [Streptomyces mirabilis]|uniref:Uncharacterized protein n=1 Tax=Streptomyces mirabilis TaxID=68239 RepID=A0ABU3V6G1_9ACTN|nr:hypothetical protein [Streptomyces mirabilis]MCX5355751.1 hypothetical protein [Streptomyces mirabilis]MDU9001394.1 hypothetical protein [Streptomyces mirabilis]
MYGTGLGVINVPTLVMAGFWASSFPPRLVHEIHAGLPDARQCERHENGHFERSEAADGCAVAVPDFLRSKEMGDWA